MSGHVIVKLDGAREFRFAAAAMADNGEARRWLDEQFVALDCEPLRASGKLLLADKLLAIAEAAGESGFADEGWGARFAAAALSATGRDLLTVDVPGRALSY